MISFVLGWGNKIKIKGKMNKLLLPLLLLGVLPVNAQQTSFPFCHRICEDSISCSILVNPLTYDMDSIMFIEKIEHDSLFGLDFYEFGYSCVEFIAEDQQMYYTRKTDTLLMLSHKNMVPHGEFWYQHYDNFKYTGNYVNGKLHGQSRTYYEIKDSTTYKKRTYQLIITVNYVEGKKEGKEFIYYPNGAICIILDYKNGQIVDGVYRSKTEYGKTYQVLRHKHGVLHGRVISYFYMESLTIKTINIYRNGVVKRSREKEIRHRERAKRK